MPETGIGVLRLIRYVALVLCSVVAAISMCRWTSPMWAITDALVFMLAFLTGLRLRAAAAHLRNQVGKDLSWSSALLVSFGTVIALDGLARVHNAETLYCVLGFEALVFYAIGKVTCTVAGCCNAAIDLPAHIRLPILEIGATCATIVVAAFLACQATVAALLALTTGHLVTRAASRYLRTGTLRSLGAPDVPALVLALLVVSFVR